MEIAVNKEKHLATVKPADREIGPAKRETDMEPIWKIETNLDDCTGEAIAFAFHELFEAGARMFIQHRFIEEEPSGHHADCSLP